MRLQGKVAIVTGGGSGIGRSTSLLLAREGAKVAVTDVSDNDGMQTLEEIKRAEGTAEYWYLDVTRESAVKDTFAGIKAKFDKIDVLVNNAGIAGVDKPTHEITEEEWDRLMAVNVKGTFFCVKHVVPYMKKNGGGSIINLSSIYGLVGAGDVPPYHASKGAVRLIAKNDALRYR